MPEQFQAAAPDPAFWRGRPVCVTGGSGFLGHHLVGQLLALRARVRVLALPPREAAAPWGGQAVECLHGDVRDAEVVGRATAGCDVVFHAAAVVAFSGRAVRAMDAVGREGTRNVLAAVGRRARVVHTSSVVAVGGSRTPEPLTEDSPFPADAPALAYVRSKRGAEALALEAAGRQDVVVVNPCFLVGPEDHGPTDMGRFCLRFWKGRLPLAFPGGLNVVDVRDVARGHILAAERGRPGRRYLLGGADCTFPALMAALAQAAGLRPRALPRLPAFLLGPLAAATTALGWLKGKPPYPSLGHARLSRRYWFARSDRAMQELGYRPRPLAETLADTYHWFRSRKDLRPRRLNAWWLRPLPEPAGTPVVLAAQVTVPTSDAAAARASAGVAEDAAPPAPAAPR
jgi:dihydroflavonol-4-reductase